MWIFGALFRAGLGSLVVLAIVAVLIGVILLIILSTTETDTGSKSKQAPSTSEVRTAH